MRCEKSMFSLLTFVVIGMLVLGLVTALDADTPFTADLSWIVPAVTSFTVGYCGAEASIDFDTNLTVNTADGIEPDCQDTVANTSMLTITNTANQLLNFTQNLTETGHPEWANITMSTINDSSLGVEFNNTAISIVENLAIGGAVGVFLWTNISAAPAGTISTNYSIQSVAT